jgi:hypothetical protein
MRRCISEDRTRHNHRCDNLTLSFDLINGHNHRCNNLTLSFDLINELMKTYGRVEP